MKRHIVVLFLLVIFSLVALADSGSYGSDFSNPQPYNPHEHEEKPEHPDVVMADEFVSIVLGADGAVVNAEFTFRNEGLAQTVSMYFPLESSSDANGYILGEPGKGLDGLEEELTSLERISNEDYEFTALVNGTNLEVKILEEGTHVLYSEYPGDFDYSRNMEAYFSNHYTDIYAIYEIPFDAGETLTLSVEYQQSYSAPKHADWCQMLYPIHTGGSWKDPIGHGIVEVTAGSDFDWNGAWQYQSVSLPPATEKDGKLIWEFSELEPEKDSIWGTCVRVMMPWGYKELDGVWGMLLGDNQPCWGIVLAESGINFRSERNNTSARVSAHTVMKEGEFFTISRRQGDWWRIEDEEGNSGWLRWRYVDGDKENIYAAITPAKNTYHALDSGA